MTPAHTAVLLAWSTGLALYSLSWCYGSAIADAFDSILADAYARSEAPTRTPIGGGTW